MKRLITWLPLLFICAATSVLADPPARVARLSYIQGTVTFSPAASHKWTYATLNRPIVAGDHIWTDKQGKAELQLGSAVIRVNNLTNLGILKFSQQMAQVQLTQGSINLRVRNNTSTTYEINTPQLALVINKPGDYRLDVSRISTKILIRNGQAIVYGKTASYRLRGQMAYTFMGNNLNPYQMLKLSRSDSFDRWTKKRDQLFYRSRSLQYVSPNMVGYEDLDSYGNWEESDEYGHVWVPTNMSVDWAPYRYGHWEWIAPWGWTWIDDEPWGFAPFHYGRWVFVDDNYWAWVPGPRRVEPVYAPALVAFIKVGNVDISISDNRMAWIPLGPRDVYVPPYSVSKNYFTNVNVSNTTIVNNTSVTNVYNNQTTIINYQNKQAADAVTVVPKNIVVAAKPIAPALVPISKEVIDKAPLQPITKPPVEPTPLSAPVSKLTDIQPPKETALTPIVVKTPTEEPATGDKAKADEKPAEIIVPAKPVTEIQPLPIKPLEPASAEPAVITKPDADKSASNKDVPHPADLDKQADNAQKEVPVVLQPATKPTQDIKPLEPPKSEKTEAKTEPELIKPIENLSPPAAPADTSELKPIIKPEEPKAAEAMPLAPIETAKEKDKAAPEVLNAPEPPAEVIKKSEPESLPLAEPVEKKEIVQAAPVETPPPAPAPVEAPPPVAQAAPPVETPPPAPAPTEAPPPAPVETAPPAVAQAAPVEAPPPTPAPVETPPPAAPAEVAPPPVAQAAPVETPPPAAAPVQAPPVVAQAAPAEIAPPAQATEAPKS